jgi:NAD(P)H-hydrate epimerase
MNARWLGVPTILLMENAGRRVAEQCGGAKDIAVFCGRGGNGGDGLACARHLHSWGRSVRVYYLSGERSVECQRNLDMLLALDIPAREFSDSSECEALKNEVSGCDLIVDALLGVGVEGEVREPVKSLVKLINSVSAKKLSIDVPSGDKENSVKADVVVSLDSAKTLNAVVVDIGIPSEAEKYCGPGDVYLAFPRRTAAAHKGDFGRVLVLGGSREYHGAPFLAAQAALYAGADLSYLAAPRKAAERMPFNANLIPIPLESEDYVTKDDVKAVLEKNFDVIVIGNGLGVNDETEGAVRYLIEKAGAPIVADADALKLIKRKHIRSKMVLTPHAGEFKALFEEYEEGRRVELVEHFARKTEAVILLKGAVDVISDGKTTRLNKTGNPAMTVGGTGDVLAGVVGGLLAQNKDPFQSACAGAFLNGLAGDIACENRATLVATDVLEKIPQAIKRSLSV